jgi:hypothetical protein
MSKLCISCNLTKNLDDFQTRKRGEKLEYLPRCRNCELKRIREWRQKKSNIKKEEKLNELLGTSEIPEGYKHCTKCLKILLLSEFGTKQKITGIFPKSWCRECERITKSESDRKKGIQPKKKTKQCRYCKNDFPLNELSKTYYCINCRDDEVQEGFKRCTFCKEIKELNKFEYRNAKGCHKMFPRSTCKICRCLIDYPRIRILHAIKTNKLSIKKEQLVGCSVKFLKNWLEWQFDSNMNWENIGSYWHIDHVTPCTSFDLSIEEEQLKCFNWTNTRPLEAKKNMSKHNKILPKEILHQEIKVKYYKNQMTAQRLDEHG